MEKITLTDVGVTFRPENKFVALFHFKHVKEKYFVTGKLSFFLS